MRDTKNKKSAATRGVDLREVGSRLARCLSLRPPYLAKHNRVE